MISGFFVMFLLGLVSGIGTALFFRALIDAERKGSKRK